MSWTYNGTMPTCPRCGEQNPDSAIVCDKCGIRFGYDIRAKADNRRMANAKVVKAVTWIAIIVVLAILAPKAYHMGYSAYLKHHLKSISDHANIYCNGPVTDTMTETQKAEINKCLDNTAELQAAQKDYDDFTKGDAK